jgi:pilus assembly protein Flp/PilA
MRKALRLMESLKRDQEGAALVEYTVLLGIMLVAVITTIGLVGGWMSTKVDGILECTFGQLRSKAHRDRARVCRSTRRRPSAKHGCAIDYILSSSLGDRAP